MNCILCQRLNAYENQFHLIVEKEDRLIYEVNEANFCGNCLIEAFANKKAFAFCVACNSVFTLPKDAFTFKKAGQELTLNGEELDALIVRMIDSCDLCSERSKG